MASSILRFAVSVDGEPVVSVSVLVNAPGVQGDISAVIRRFISEVLEPEEPRRPSSLEELLRRRRSSGMGVNLDDPFPGDPDWLDKLRREFVSREEPDKPAEAVEADEEAG